jgi:hypothetical protein
MKEAIGGFLLIAVSFFIYFLPSIVALKRKAKQDAAVLVVNLFL